MTPGRCAQHWMGGNEVLRPVISAKQPGHDLEQPVRAVSPGLRVDDGYQGSSGSLIGSHRSGGNPQCAWTVGSVAGSPDGTVAVS
jgi:hypothetical protein